MNRNVKLIIIGSIIFLLLTFSNHISETYPSTKIAVVAFDSLMFIVLLRLAFKEIKQVIQETSVKFFVVYSAIVSIVVSLVAIYLVVRLVA